MRSSIQLHEIQRPVFKKKAQTSVRLDEQNHLLQDKIGSIGLVMKQ